MKVYSILNIVKDACQDFCTFFEKFKVKKSKFISKYKYTGCSDRYNPI